MKKRKILFVFIGVMVVDHLLAYWANERILARKADFEERMAADFGKINWRYKFSEQLCEERIELIIYKYKSCFKRAGLNPGTNGEGYYIRSMVYVYVAPRGLFNWTRILWSNKHYLSSTTIFHTEIARINRNGDILRWLYREKKH